MSGFPRSGALVVLVLSAVLLPLRAGAQAVLSVSPTSISLQGTAGSNVASSTVRINNGGNRALRWSIVPPTATWLTVSPNRGVNNGTLTLTFRTSGLPAGQHSTSFKVETDTGSAVTVSVQINFAAATLIPKLAVSCPSSMTSSSSTGSAMPVSYSVTTSGGVAPVTVSGNPASGSPFPVGTTTVQVNAKSSDGQTASCSFPVMVTSTVAKLTVSCPSNATVASSSGSPVPVTYTPTTSGGVAPVTVNASPSSGSQFAVGTTNVQVNAKSSDGQTAGCGFTVTVTAPSSDGWTFCASEGGFCAFSGTMNVRYGANGSYYYKSLSGGTACTNAVFGDPAVNTPKQCSIGGAAPTTPPPPTTSSYGPRSTITCPSGALDIWPGSLIPNIVNLHSAGTTYCLRAGVHAITGAITPKRGDTFVGEFGAILDGSGWTTSDDTQAAFRAHNQDIDYVTIRNLVIRNMPQRGIHAYYYMADHWTIEYNEIAHTRYTGLVFPGDSIIRNNYIHHNQFAGYMGPYAHNTVVEGNEIAYNGGQNKIAETRNVTFRNNFVHHNAGTGIWYDSNNTGAVVEGNRVEDNGHHRHLLRDQQRWHHPEQHHPAERGCRRDAAPCPGTCRFTTTRSTAISGGSPTSSTAPRSRSRPASISRTTRRMTTRSSSALRAARSRTASAMRRAPRPRSRPI